MSVPRMLWWLLPAICMILSCNSDPSTTSKTEPEQNTDTVNESRSETANTEKIMGVVTVDGKETTIIQEFEKPIEIREDTEPCPPWKKRFFKHRSGLLSTGIGDPAGSVEFAIARLGSDEDSERVEGLKLMKHFLVTDLLSETENLYGYSPSATKEEREQSIEKLNKWLDQNGKYLTFAPPWMKGRYLIDEEARTAGVPMVYWVVMSEEERELALQDAAEKR